MSQFIRRSALYNTATANAKCDGCGALGPDWYNAEAAPLPTDWRAAVTPIPEQPGFSMQRFFCTACRTEEVPR